MLHLDRQMLRLGRLVGSYMMESRASLHLQ
jgi:hypothetical protein